MKFGVREICDVVLRAKTAQKIGKKIFYKNEPVCYFDTLKTSTMEGAATTVYAQGGRGNARLMSWDGERTVTFTMEDALISPVGLSILTGAGLIEAGDGDHTVIQHITETVKRHDNGKFYVKNLPYTVDNEATIYVMILDDNGEVISEPYLGKYDSADATGNGYRIIFGDSATDVFSWYAETDKPDSPEHAVSLNDIVLVDYYTQHPSGAFEVNITPDKFGGTFYLEASTLWRDQATKKDLPAEFIIPACRVQSNFTFSMSSSGDPSTFTFTMDAFPDYTRWNKTEKVLATIQVLGANLEGVEEPKRDQTWSNRQFNDDGTLKEATRTLLTSPTVGTPIYNTEGADAGTVTVSISNSSIYDAISVTIIDNKGKIRTNNYSIDTDGGNFYVGTLAAGTYYAKIQGYKDNQVSAVVEKLFTVS